MFLDQNLLDEEYLNHLTLFHLITQFLNLSTNVEWLFNFLKREREGERNRGSLEDNYKVNLTLNT